MSFLPLEREGRQGSSRSQNGGASKNAATEAQPSAAREIPLTKGYVAIVDAADYERVSAKKWTTLTRGRRISAQHYWRDGAKVRAIGLGRFVIDAPEGLQVDHINGDPLDNRRANLRLCSQPENARNRRAPVREGRYSQYKGVYANPRWGKRYRVRISADGKNHWVGTFDDEVEAARAYDAAALRLHGEFARLNFPEGA